MLNNLAIPMTGKNLAIAKAAAKAGFECSDLERVMLLVNAVRDADLKAGYPDYYVGQSKKLSNYHPARTRQRHHYRDLDNPAVPAFTLDATQIVRNIEEWGSASFSFQNTRNPGINKRPGTDNYGAGAAKKSKTSSTTHTATTQTVTVDLTQDDFSTGQQQQQHSAGYVHPARLDRVPGATILRYVAYSCSNIQHLTHRKTGNAR